MAVPVVILLRTKDPVVKANAIEATNYAITAIVLLVILFLGSIFLVLGVVAILLVFWPLFLLIGLPIIIYSIAFSAWPIYAAVVSARQPGRIVRYPKLAGFARFRCQVNGRPVTGHELLVVKDRTPRGKPAPEWRIPNSVKIWRLTR